MLVQIELEELNRLKEIEEKFEESKAFYSVRKPDGTIHFFFWENKIDIERAYFERYGKLINEQNEIDIKDEDVIHAIKCQLKSKGYNYGEDSK